MSSKIKQVTVLGLGAMGHAFAANILKKDFALKVWNRSADKGKDLQSAGATLADSPEDAVQGSEVVLLMLADAKITLDVVKQALPGFAQQAIVVQMGTIGVEATSELHHLLSEQRPDLRFVDAPVSGTKKPAEQAQISILASGDKALQTEVEPVFSAISKGTHWLGDVGAGSAMKLVVNSWLIGLMQSLAESQCLATKFGFSPQDLWSVLEGGPLAAPYAKLKLEMISGGDYTPQMQLKWAQKDAALAVEAGEERQIPNLVQINKIWQQAIEAGYGDDDLAVVAKYLAEQ